METFDYKLPVVSDSTVRGLANATNVELTRRRIAKRVWDIATVAVLVALVYHYAQRSHDSLPNLTRPPHVGTICDLSSVNAEPDFDWYNVGCIHTLYVTYC